MSEKIEGRKFPLQKLIFNPRSSKIITVYSPWFDCQRVSGQSRSSISMYQSSYNNPPLLWASSCDRELTATLHSEQYSSFLALSSSVSGLDGLGAVLPTAPETGGPDPGCSELGLPVPQPGEDDDGGIRGGVGVGRRGHTEGMEQSMGMAGGSIRGVRGPGASRGTVNCDRGRVSSRKTKKKYN